MIASLAKERQPVFILIFTIYSDTYQMARTEKNDLTFYKGANELFFLAFA